MRKKYEETLKRFKPEIDSGLSQKDVAYRISHGQTNKIKNETEKSYLQIIISTVMVPSVKVPVLSRHNVSIHERASTE